MDIKIRVAKESDKARWLELFTDIAISLFILAEVECLEYLQEFFVFQEEDAIFVVLSL